MAEKNIFEHGKLGERGSLDRDFFRWGFLYESCRALRDEYNQL